MEELGQRALTDLVELLEKGIEVIPPYLVDLFNRYAMFGIFKEGFMTLLCLGVFIGSIIGGLKLYKACDKDIDSVGAIIVLFLVPIVLSIVGFFMCGADLLEAIFIPEIYVIHDLQGCTSCG